jgi:hypothetical protein
MRIRSFTKLFLVASLSSGAAIAACGDDDNFVVRTRNDGGTDGAVEGGEGGLNALACGVPIPATYDSPNFAANAKEELDLKANVLAIGDKMKTAEGPTPLTVTTADLNAIFTAGAPSVRSVATAFTQVTVDTYLTQFGDSTTKTWKPEDVDADGGVDGGSDGGAPSGGKYDNASIVNAVGVDLREATEKLLINGSLYNYALALAGGAITEATVDRLLGLYGASPALLNAADGDAGAETNELVAEYAFKRDSKIGAPGSFRKIRTALLVMKAAAANGDKCRADFDGALKIFFLEWEKASFATVIYYLNQAATNATVIPAKGQLALHAFGEALGFAQSFKGVPQDRRKITDVQIDAILTRIGATTPYQLVTRTGERVVAFNTAFQEIGAIYGMTQTDIEDAKKAY